MQDRWNEIPINEQFSNELEGRLSESGLSIKRLDNLGRLDLNQNQVMMTITLCPLYGQSTIEQSELITQQQGIEESRVYGKLVDGLKTVEAVNQTASRFGKNMHVVWTLADMGVLLEHQSGNEAKILKQHGYRYRRAIEAAKEMAGISWEFKRYSDFEFQALPQFLSVGNRRQEILGFYRDLTGSRPIVLSADNFSNGVLNQGGELNGAGSKIIQSLVDAFGHETARNFLIQYGFYDNLTSLPGALNCYFERADLLLNITNLFRHREYSRMDILCG